MKLIKDSSPTTTNPIIIDNSPVKVDRSVNVLSPLINYPTIIDDNYMNNLKKEHEILIKRFDDRIENFNATLRE